MPGLNSFHTKMTGNLMAASGLSMPGSARVITGKVIKQSSNPFLKGYGYKMKNQLFKLKKF